jgi:hypothetical protein
VELKLKIGTLFLLLSAAFIVGCDQSTPEVAPVKGKVLIDGQPLKKGNVITLPSAGRGARGVIASDGTFELTTYVKGDGARIGMHKVGVVAYEGGGKGPEAELGKLLVPQRYISTGTSGLTIEVTADGPNEPVLELSSK